MDIMSDRVTTTAHSRIGSIVHDLVGLVEELEHVEPNRFTRMVAGAGSAGALFDAVIALRYAANAKELRDTGDARVHDLCERILVLAGEFFEFMTMRLHPASASQRQSWESAVARTPYNKYALRQDGSVEFSLLETHLGKGVLRVARTWSHVCSFDGSPTDLAIQIDAQQASAVTVRQAQARVLQAVLDDR